MKRAGRSTKRRRERGGLDWVKKRQSPVINVLIADSDKASRAACLRALHSMRGVRVVGEAATGLEAVSATAKLKPRVVLLDLELSSEFGASLIAVVRRKSARTRVILLVGRASEERILEALSHGAVGCVTKKNISRFLPEALEAVSSGEAWMSRKLIPKIMDRLADFTARAEGQQ
ncbi:MAG TPA: response regulator [Thermoanaerobaculia bacterium]|jgi:DNA-binding NarL/FixJ family response regulator